MVARLEYILQPVAFGFGTATVAMIGTNWGAQQDRRAREIAWTGATTVALMCGTIGMIVAFQPGLRIGLFSDEFDTYVSLPPGTVRTNFGACDSFNSVAQPIDRGAVGLGCPSICRHLQRLPPEHPIPLHRR
jgi:hypothetical protein